MKAIGHDVKEFRKEGNALIEINYQLRADNNKLQLMLHELEQYQRADN